MNAVQLIAVLREGGWPEDRNLLTKMAAIGLAESSGNPSAVNRGKPAGKEHSVGLWQINMKAHGTRYGTEEELKNAVTNAEAALSIYRAQGLRAWGAYTDKRYLRRLPEAESAYGGSSESNETAGDDKEEETDTTLTNGLGVLAIVLLVGYLAG